MPYLIHHGIKGQKWGVRRFQNEDGTLTNAGKRRDIKKTEKTTITKEVLPIKMHQDLKKVKELQNTIQM